MIEIQTPFQYFTDAAGEPLENGYIYIGTVNLNPETNPIAIYWDSDGTIPAANPLRTSGGYIVRNGAAAFAYINATNYSLTLRDKNGVLVRSVLNVESRFAGSGGAFLIGYQHDNTGTVLRTVADALDDYYPSIRDFGALGDGNNDSAAFALAEASDALQIYIPDGNWICTDSGTFLKTYYGPGTISGTASVIVPGNYEKRTALFTPTPSSGGGNYWAGDTSYSRQRYSVLGPDVKAGLDWDYFCSQTTPWFEVFDNYSGSSGCIALVSSPITAGDLTANVNSVVGFTVGQEVALINNADSTIGQVLVIGSIGASAIGFGGEVITDNYAIGTRITATPRTNASSHHYEVNHYGAGDSYTFMTRLVAGYPGLPGQEHFMYRSTVGMIGGDATATEDGVYMQFCEAIFVDAGHDVAVIGQAMGYNRTNSTAALYEVWFDKFIQSYGTEPMDAGFVLAGKFKCGIDMARADFSSNGQNAIGLAVDQRIYWGNTASPDPTGLPGTLWGDTNSTNYDTWTGASRVFVVGNNPTWSLSSTGCQAVGFIETTAYYGVDGIQVVGNQRTGYGTPTGNVQTINFPGATATLLQTSQQLAQLMLDLKTHGLIGA